MKRVLYVFIQLPDRLDSIVAGRFTHERGLDNPTGSFTYAKSYLERKDSVALDPVALPLRQEEFRTQSHGGYFGILLDALPDDWGRKLAAVLGHPADDNFDLLLAPSRDRVGALRFGPTPAAPIPDEPVASLDSMTEALVSGLEKIDQEKPLTPGERDAILAAGGGTTAGGARPKLTVVDASAHWIAKLPRADDKWNYARAECAMLDLASLAGIEVPEHRVTSLANRETLLVKRFDRKVVASGTLRYRVASARTVFCADEAYWKSSPFGSYSRLARELQSWGTEVPADRAQLFRRVAFNCLAGVTDDHERNHSLVASSAHFRLAPAYDLNPTIATTRRRFQAMATGDFGAASTKQNLLSAIGVYGLDGAAANKIIEDVRVVVAKNWRPCLRKAGLPPEQIEKFAASFNAGYFDSILGESGNDEVETTPGKARSSSRGR